MNHYTYIIDLPGHESYHEGDLKFIAKILIKLELDMWMCLFGSCKSNVMFLISLIYTYAKHRTNPYIMRDSYCIIPRMNHYTYIVDLLGHASYPDGALNFISKIPIKLESCVWMFLLGTCKLNVMVLNSLIYMYAKCETNITT